RISRVARKQDDLHTRGLGCRTLVEGQQLAHQWERDAGLEHVVLVGALVLGIGLDALALEQLVAVLQVEQRARGDRDDQRRRWLGCRGHARKYARTQSQPVRRARLSS